MEGIKDKPKITIEVETISEYRTRVKKRTCNIKELAEILEISEAKARQLTHIQGFPCMSFGRDRRVILSKLDEWLENNLGQVL